MRYARILGTGSYLPKRVVTNVELEATLNTTDTWIKERTGIEQRHVAGPQETTAFMAAQAAKQALSAAQLQQVDMILVATTTPDAFFPSTACLVQTFLGLQNCPAFDVAAACTGFNYALSIADQFIQTNKYQYILVIGSETMSRVVDWNNRNTCILFGDGAGAVLLGPSQHPGILETVLQADGRYQELLYLNNLRAPDPGVLKMEGSQVFKQAVLKMSEILLTVLEKQSTSITDFDWLIPHQANLRIMQALGKRLKLPQSKFIMTIAQHANTSAASIPLALDIAIRDQRIQPGQRLLLVSFGGGITWGATLLKY